MLRLPGEDLSIPQYIPVTNNASNHLPYVNFLSIMSLHLDPYVKVEHHTNFLESIVEVLAVAVAVAVVAAPHLAPVLFGAALSGFSGMVAVSMVAIFARQAFFAFFKFKVLKSNFFLIQNNF